MSTLALVPSLDFTTFSTSTSTGLSPTTLSYINTVFIKITPDTYPKGLAFIQEHFKSYNFIADVSLLLSSDDIRQVLNNGVSKVVVNEAQLKELTDFGIDESRLIVTLQANATSQKGRVGVLFQEGSAERVIKNYQDESKSSSIYVQLSSPTSEDIQWLSTVTATLVIPSSNLTVTPKEYPGLLSVANIYSTFLKSDREDELISTLVTDEQGIALGLVYSNEESITESLRTGTGVYWSRKRGLWYKGATSGDTQELVRIDMDCDRDCLRFVVRQKGKALQQTLQSRFSSAPEGSYTARLFSDPALLKSKIMEEAEELCEAKTKQEIAFEAADLIYFVLTKCTSAGVTLSDVERSLDLKSLKVERRKGDAKPKWSSSANGQQTVEPTSILTRAKDAVQQTVTKVTEAVKPNNVPQQTNGQTRSSRIQMKHYDTSSMTTAAIEMVLQRPSQKSTETIMGIVQPIIAAVRKDGDSALLSYTRKFDRCPDLTSPVLLAPFPEHLMNISSQTKKAIDLSYDNIYKFHKAQKEDQALSIETMEGVRCSRFSRPIERVGLYVPGGTAVLPSTALMLGVPAMVAGCKTIVFASPPRQDCSITPEIVYIAHKVGAKAIVLAGGAQAVAALAYGTESVPKVDKILGPGNQFVTAAKMLVSNDTSAGVSIDMPAGPSEVLVIADKKANPIFVASDLLSQAEHGVDSQVVLIAVDLNDDQLEAIDDELHKQAMALPRVDIVRGAIDHSVTLRVDTMERAFELSNVYAPEHLILQIDEAASWVDKVYNAGSVFIGEWTPESVGDYSAGVNHSLPTYGYAKQYSGVNLATFVKHITSSQLTANGLKNLGNAVVDLANVEGLDAHARAVELRLRWMNENGL